MKFLLIVSKYIIPYFIFFKFIFFVAFLNLIDIDETDVLNNLSLFQIFLLLAIQQIFQLFETRIEVFYIYCSIILLDTWQVRFHKKHWFC